MTKCILPHLIFDLIDDAVVMAVMAADGIDKESVVAVLDHAAAKLSQQPSEPGSKAATVRVPRIEQHHDPTSVHRQDGFGKRFTIGVACPRAKPKGANMSQPPVSFRNALKEAKRWADVYSFASIVLVVGLGIVAWWLGGSSNVDLETKIEMQIMMAAIVIVVSIWQAAAFAVAALRSSRSYPDSRDYEDLRRAR